MAWFLPIMGIYILSYVCIYLVIFFFIYSCTCPEMSSFVLSSCRWRCLSGLWKMGALGTRGWGISCPEVHAGSSLCNRWEEGCVVGYRGVPYHTIPYPMPFQTMIYHTIPYHTIAYHTIQHHTLLYPMIRYDQISRETSICEVVYSITPHLIFGEPKFQPDTRTRMFHLGNWNIQNRKAGITLLRHSQDYWGWEAPTFRIMRRLVLKVHLTPPSFASVNPWLYSRWFHS